MSEPKSLYEELAEIAVPEGEVMPETETQPESQPETKPTESAPSQEGEVPTVETPKVETPTENKEIPFHKNPRWKKIQEELKAERQAREAMEAKFKELETWKQSQGAQKPTKVPDEFKALYGDDPEAFAKWQEYQDQFVKDRFERFYSERQTSEKEKAQQEERSRKVAVEWAESELEELSDEMGVDLTDRKNSVRNQILDLWDKWQVYNEQGLPDLRRIVDELYPKYYPPTTDAVLEEKKKAAAKASVKSGGTSSGEQVMTSSRLKKMNVQDFFK